MNTLTLTPGISVRRLDLSEYKDAASLSLEIYLQTGEEDFDEQGLETFKSFVNDEAMINSLVIYGAFDEARLVGVMAVKDEGKHISLFFIREEYHRKGIGRRLFDAFIEEISVPEMTVNSSTYAVPFYKSLGFEQVQMLVMSENEVSLRLAGNLGFHRQDQVTWGGSLYERLLLEL